MLTKKKQKQQQQPKLKTAVGLTYAPANKRARMPYSAAQVRDMLNASRTKKKKH